LPHCHRQGGAGALNPTHGIPMVAQVIREALKRAGIDGAKVEDVVVL
jgi:hypothetical protein